MKIRNLSRMSVIAFFFLIAGFSRAEDLKPQPAKSPAVASAAPTTRPAGSPLERKVLTIDGEEKDLGEYRGYVVLIVNVASKCGYTTQYAGLEKLYRKYRGQAFVVLAFPSNDFGGQEPGSNAEIKKFAQDKFGVSFPMMAKVIVKGPKKTALYHLLTAKESGGEFAGEVQWNFTKFLIGRDGKVVGRFASKVTPEDPKFIAEIEAATSEPIGEAPKKSPPAVSPPK